MANVTEYVEKIEELLSKIPDKRRKKIYQEWLTQVNELIQKCNELSKFKMYKKR